MLFDDGHLVFLKRGWPGGDPYCTAVGGSVEPEDADLEAALRREALEEIGATIGPVTEFLTLTEPRGTSTVVQHYFRADLVAMDPNLRHGPELDDPDTGLFEPVRVAVSRPAVAPSIFSRPSWPTTCSRMSRTGAPDSHTGSQHLELGEELEGVGVDPVLHEPAVAHPECVGAGERDHRPGLGLGAGKPPA